MKWPQFTIIDECNEHLGPLMTRYYLTPKILGLRLCMHKFYRGDNDRHFHDHPWNFITCILKGNYYENQPDGRFFRRRWSILSRSKYHKHWVELSDSNPVWTIILLWGIRRDWGFWTEKGWIKHDSYDCRG